MERVYKTMRNAGALNIVIGIIITVAGLSVGIMSIINGAGLGDFHRLPDFFGVLPVLLRGLWAGKPSAGGVRL